MNERHFVLITGNVCNNHCIFCPNGDDKRDCKLNHETLIRIIDESKSNHDFITLSGGEVTIRDDFLDICQHAHDINYGIIVQTNARKLADPSLCLRLVEQGEKIYHVSFHSHVEAVHDHLTRRSGSLEQVRTAIRNLRNLNQKVITNTVIAKQNYADLKGTVNSIFDMGVTHIQLAAMHPIGNANRNAGEVLPSFSEIYPYVRKAVDLSAQRGGKILLEAFPYCVCQGMYEHVAEPHIPKMNVRNMEQELNGFKKYRLEGKSKMKKCVDCCFNQICEGPWKEYIDFYGEEEFNPITDIESDEVFK